MGEDDWLEAAYEEKFEMYMEETEFDYGPQFGEEED